MRLELNIRVDRPGATTGMNNAEAIRIVTAIHAAGFAEVYKIQRIQRQLETQSGDLELVDVIWAYVKTHAFSDKQTITALCQALEREAIATVDTFTGKGVILGPGADLYGRFDDDKFIQPAGVAA